MALDKLNWCLFLKYCMTDFFNVFDLSFDNIYKILNKTLHIQENQRFQGFISSIGMTCGDYLNFETPDNLIVIGDLHGDFEALRRIMEIVDFDKYLKFESNLLIFLGDYIDRGKYSTEVLLFLCQLKNYHPNNVMMLKGNHESFEKFPFSAYDFKYNLKNLLGTKSDMLYKNVVIPLFDSFYSICDMNNFALLMHGGLPVITNSVFFNNYKFYLSNLDDNISMLEELLWNDPRDYLIHKLWETSRRGLGKYFGIDVTNMWLSNTNSKFVIRGHEPCMGYKLNHNNKVLTLFSSRDPYPNFKASFLKMSNDEINNIDSNGMNLVPYITIL